MRILKYNSTNGWKFLWKYILAGIVHIVIPNNTITYLYQFFVTSGLWDWLFILKFGMLDCGRGFSLFTFASWFSFDDSQLLTRCLSFGLLEGSGMSVDANTSITSILSWSSSLQYKMKFNRKYVQYFVYGNVPVIVKLRLHVEMQWITYSDWCDVLGSWFGSPSVSDVLLVEGCGPLISLT